jgi:hypothetical protein
MRNPVVFFLLCLTMTVAGITASPASGASSPSLNGKWAIQQKNSSGLTFRGHWIITQHGSEISGSAEWENHMQGRIQGALTGNRVDLTIYYAGELKGFYKGALTADCTQILHGTSTASQGSDSATWTAVREAPFNGKWAVQQKNASGTTYRGTWQLTQSANRLSGTAEWENHARGEIQGTLQGNGLDLTISYPDGMKGTYQGSLAPGCSQVVSGTTTANRGSDSGTWRAEPAD